MDFDVDVVGRAPHGSGGDWCVAQWSSGLLEDGWGFQGLPTTGVLVLTPSREKKRVRNAEKCFCVYVHFFSPRFFKLYKKMQKNNCRKTPYIKNKKLNIRIYL